MVVISKPDTESDWVEALNSSHPANYDCFKKWKQNMQ